MSRDRQVLKPTPFTAAAPAPAASSPAPEKHSPWLWPALLLLAVLAVAVVFWLPGWLAGSDPETAANGSTASAPSAGQGTSTLTTSTAASSPAAAAASPWSDAQSARQRSAAQEALDALLQQQYNLEERGAPDWAATEWEAALTQARSGDELYQAREFDAAGTRYREALAALQQLESSIPARLERAAADTEAALQALDEAAAEAALRTLRQLDPTHRQLEAFSSRLDSLPSLAELLSQAASQEGEGDLAAARGTLQQASETDPAHRGAREALQRVAAALEEARFQRAMSRGYAALDSGDFGAASEAFREAGKYRPDSPELAAARSELGTQSTIARLKRLEQQAAASERTEDWAAAVEHYREALETDASLVFAQQGLARAEPRAALQKELQSLLDEPDRLATEAVARQAEGVLARAAAVSDAGPRLREQREQLAQALALATTPVPVTLLSDGQTEVTLLRVSRLGSFSEQSLTLRPGTYTALGSRDGFRDVRKTFTVSHDEPAPRVHVACSEPI